MKKIEATIRKSKFEDVKEALYDEGVMFLTYWDITGIGNEKEGHVYRGISFNTSEIQRRYISFVVSCDKSEKCINAILKYAKTGNVGDGKIFISNVEETYRIRTGEKGIESLNK